MFSNKIMGVTDLSEPFYGISGQYSGISVNNDNDLNNKDEDE
jgi:hypothetical protein